MLARLARFCLGYELYHVYGWEPLSAPATVSDRAAVSAARMLPRSWSCAALNSTAELEQADNAELAALAAYGGDDARLFGLRASGRLIAGCAFWWGERYRRRKSWRLRPGEAKLVQVTTAAVHRGQGAAAALIRGSSEQMALAGFGRLYARIWHSHVASRRAFESAGWSRVGWIVGLNPLWLPRFRFRLGVRPRGGDTPWRGISQPIPTGAQGDIARQAASGTPTGSGIPQSR